MEVKAETSRESVADIPRQQRPKLTWVELKNQVRDIRAHLVNHGGNGLPHSFILNDFDEIFFLSSVGESGNSLFTVDIRAANNIPGSSTDCELSLPWKELIPAEFQERIHRQREQEDLQTPTVIPRGISSYNFFLVERAWEMFLFESSNTSAFLYWCKNENYPLTPIEIKARKCSGPRLNAEIGPNKWCLVAYVNGSDLWVVHIRSGSEVNVTSPQKSTSCTEIKKPTRKHKSAGYPTSFMREAFYIQHGFWWQPLGNHNTYRILYEEFDDREDKPCLQTY